MIVPLVGYVLQEEKRKHKYYIIHLISSQK